MSMLVNKPKGGNTVHGLPNRTDLAGVAQGKEVYVKPEIVVMKLRRLQINAL